MSNTSEKALEWWQSLSDEESDNILKENGILGHDQAVNEDEIVSFFKEYNSEKAQSATEFITQFLRSSEEFPHSYNYYQFTEEISTHKLNIAKWMDKYAQYRNSKLETDLAKSQEKCKAYKEALPVWISVKDRLPETYSKVLIYGRYTRDCPRNVYEAVFHIKGRYFSATGGIKSKDVTHWMPLPEPPAIAEQALKPKEDER